MARDKKETLKKKNQSEISSILSTTKIPAKKLYIFNFFKEKKFKTIYKNKKLLPLEFA